MSAIVRPFGGHTPRLGRGVFVAETAALIGDVELGDAASVWYACVLRADDMPIRIGARSNIQDGTVIHVTSQRFGTTIGCDCTIGHAVIVHACTIEDRCLIGMGSTILDGARVGAGSLVGAGTLITPGTDIPPGSFVLGRPGRVVRPAGDKERAQIEFGAAHYVELASRYLAGDGGSSLP